MADDFNKQDDFASRMRTISEDTFELDPKLIENLCGLIEEEAKKGNTSLTFNFLGPISSYKLHHLCPDWTSNQGESDYPKGIRAFVLKETFGRNEPVWQGGWSRIGIEKVKRKLEKLNIKTDSNPYPKRVESKYFIIASYGSDKKPFHRVNYINLEGNLCTYSTRYYEKSGKNNPQPCAVFQIHANW